MRRWIRRHQIGLLLATALGLAILVLLTVASLLTLRTYSQVKGPLQAAQNTLTSLAHDPNQLDSSSGRFAVELRLVRASDDITLAQQRIFSSTGLKILGVLPGLHTQKMGLEQLVRDLNATTKAAAGLLVSVNALAAHSQGTNVSLDDLRSLGRVMGTVRQQLASEDRPVAGLWGPLGADRQKFDKEDQRAVHLLNQGVALAHYALPFLGANGPRTYLVMGENNAEMRDEGTPLSYALMHTSNGMISITNGGTIHDLQLTSPASGVTIPAGTQAVFGGLTPTETWQNTNATGDFPFSGTAMQAMYAQSTGNQVDGVVGLDEVALQGLLRLSGPVSVAGISQPVTSSNAPSILLNQLYAGLPPGSSQAPRREELASVASQTVQQLQSGKVDLVALARVLANEIGGRHLQLWDTDPTYEHTITELGASGSVDTVDPSRTFHLAVENATASKLDYFVTVNASVRVFVLKNGAAVVQTAVTIKNSAPGGLPPSYQLGPDGGNASVEGQYVGRVFLWGPRRSTQPGAIAESGLSLNPEQDVSLLPGQTKTVHFQTTIPHALQSGRLKLEFVPQPRLQPIGLEIQMVTPSLQAGQHARIQRAWDKNLAFSWAFG